MKYLVFFLFVCLFVWIVVSYRGCFCSGSFELFLLGGLFEFYYSGCFVRGVLSCYSGCFCVLFGGFSVGGLGGACEDFPF